MKEIINVATGEVKSGEAGNVLVSNAIGSCIVVVALDRNKYIGVMSHIMLPGKAPNKETHQKTKYAVDAIETMLFLLHQNARLATDFCFCLVGAANVLKKEDDTICDNNIQSVLQILSEKQFQISAQDLGGDLRRSVRLDIDNAKVYYTRGDSEERLLFSVE